jgi:hypothetical protein
MLLVSHQQREGLVTGLFSNNLIVFYHSKGFSFLEKSHVDALKHTAVFIYLSASSKELPVLLIPALLQWSPKSFQSLLFCKGFTIH